MVRIEEIFHWCFEKFSNLTGTLQAFNSTEDDDNFEIWQMSSWFGQICLEEVKQLKLIECKML